VECKFRKIHNIKRNIANVEVPVQATVQDTEQ